ncbi:MAG: acetylglutamate kinase [Victivallales bacterium]|nr:acetylglutamate kinase [Victivallales bacterium]
MTEQELIAKAEVLLEALPYIQAFQGALVLVKFGGSAMENPEITRRVLRDVAYMHAAGMRPLVVHGGGKAITAELKSQGVSTRFVNGLRYTDDATIQVVDKVLHNTVNANLVEGLRLAGAKATAVSGKDVLRARRITTRDSATGEELSLGFVGEVVNVDTRQIHWVLDRGEIPVITPLACDMNGQAFNVNADMAACVIAAQLKVRKLVFLSDVPGVLRDPADPSSLIPTIHVGEIDHLAEDGVISGGMLPKLHSAAEAIRAGVGQVFLIDGRTPHSLLLEFFTVQGTGTMVVPD